MFSDLAPKQTPVLHPYPMLPRSDAGSGAGRSWVWTCSESCETSYRVSHSLGQACRGDTGRPSETEGEEPQVSQHWVSSSAGTLAEGVLWLYIRPKSVGQMSWVCVFEGQGHCGVTSLWNNRDTKPVGPVWSKTTSTVGNCLWCHKQKKWYNVHVWGDWV